MFLLQSFPETDDIPLEEFIQGSRADLEEVTRRFCEEYNTDTGSQYAQEWEYFRDHIAPQSDSVEEYNKNNPIHIPFKSTLLRGEPLSVSIPEVSAKSYACSTERDRPRKSEPLDFVQWSRRGKSKSNDDPSLHVPNIVIEGPPGIERFSVPVYCKSKKSPDTNQELTVDVSGLRLPPLSRTGMVSAIDSSADPKNIEASSDGSDDEDTNSDEDINGWVTCRGNHDIPKYFCARDCVGNTFHVPEKFLSKAFFSSKCPVGKIHSIVRKVGAQSNDVFFKFYNHIKYPDGPPP